MALQRALFAIEHALVVALANMQSAIKPRVDVLQKEVAKMQKVKTSLLADDA